MREIAHCPECHSKVTRVMRRVLCPRCKHVFEYASTAVTADGPGAPLIALENSPLTKGPLRIRPPGRLQGQWQTMIARLVIAVSVALALFPVAYHAYDRWLYRWIGPEVHFNHRIEISRPRQVEPTLHGYCALAMLTGFVALALWYGVARHNAEIVAQGMTWPTFSPFAVPLLLVVGGLLFCFADIEDFSQLAVGAALLGCASLIYPYLKLDEIWRASDPKVLVSSEAWKERNPSWLVGAWGLSLFTATWLFILPTPEWAANVNVAITGIVMTTIVRSVTRRQQVRYRRLYGKDSTHT